MKIKKRSLLNIGNSKYKKIIELKKKKRQKYVFTNGLNENFLLWLLKKNINKFLIIFSFIFLYIAFTKKPQNLNQEIINIRINNYRINSSLLNKGFLNINTTHKGKFTHYNYTSNIKVFKDLYIDNSYIPITDSNYILQSNQISKEEFSKLCEDGVLLDKTKYKRNKFPRISVVIPYFNSGNFSITMNLRSIQNQSFKNIEIIYVDDGSTEEKVKDILEAMKDDNRIILLKHKERKTTLLTRVDGIRYSSGEYIIQIDQDDMYINNLLFEKLYNKSKELNLDLIQFYHFSNDNPKVLKLERNPMPKNVIITQPELRTAFLLKGSNSRLYYLKIRMIWNIFARRESYMEGIEDLGDEYMNHQFRLYEDTIMLFELSQVSYSYYFYDIEGYRQCTFNSGKTTEKNITINKEIMAKDQLLFIKLLLYKVDPKYDRYHIYRELGFGKCDHDVKYLNKNDFNLGLEVVEAVFELERIYHNTASQLIQCINKIKKYYEV